MSDDPFLILSSTADAAGHPPTEEDVERLARFLARGGDVRYQWAYEAVFGKLDEDADVAE